MERLTAEELLRRRIGLDPSSTGPGLVERAVRTRKNALGLDPADDERYSTLVNNSPAELQALVEVVVVPESWFFRDQHPYTLLADFATARWLNDPSRPPLGVLSVPCAGGEEPYSIAIALLDRGLAAPRFRIDAVDVSRAVLASARRGTYSDNAFRSRDLSFRDKYFRRTPAGYELSDRVTSAVEFHPGNLLDPSLLADRPPYDVIFCRNLLIYLDEPARRQAMANLDRLLSPTGLLVVGHAEQLGDLGARFRPAGDRRCFAFERVPPGGTEPPPGAPRLPARRPPARAPAVIPKRQDGVPEPNPKPRANAEAPRAKPPPAMPVPVPVPEAATSSLTEAARLADQGRYDEAAALCEQVIARGGPSASAYFLLGAVRQAGDDRDRAERCFEKAVYLDPRHEEALLALALLAQRRGDPGAAAGYRRRAERAFQEKHPQ